MSQKANPIQRLLLLLSGAPAELAAPAAPAPPAEDTIASEPAELAVHEPAAPPEVEAVQPAGPEPLAAAASEPVETPEQVQPASAAVYPEATTMNNDPVNQAGAYGVAVVRADVPAGETYWRLVRVRHLTPDENQGRHHIFLDALDEAGARAFGAQARVTWPGGEQTITVDKPLGEPGANFPMWKWQICAVGMLGLPSDRVENLHTAHPDEPPGLGNTLFHHSFEVIYQRAVSGGMTPPPPPDDKLLERYVLFGPPASSRTAVYLELARGYLLARQPAFGFDAGEAIHARHVVIVGELQDVSQEAEDTLRQAGCQVQRIQGTPEQVASALRSLQGGQVFVPMVSVSQGSD
jgi:hypothetical protein